MLSIFLLPPFSYVPVFYLFPFGNLIIHLHRPPSVIESSFVIIGSNCNHFLTFLVITELIDINTGCCVCLFFYCYIQSKHKRKRLYKCFITFCIRTVNYLIRIVPYFKRNITCLCGCNNRSTYFIS